MAKSRLRMLKRKFSSNPNVVEDYKNTVETYISDGHARLVAAFEAKDSKQSFLEHYAEINLRKCRVNFDCASQYKEISLNDVIL